VRSAVDGDDVADDGGGDGVEDGFGVGWEEGSQMMVEVLTW